MHQFNISLDMRVPEFGTSRSKSYAEALDMCAWADTRGFAHINVMEHHGAEDGYMPAPFVFGGAVAARTKNLKIVLGAVLLPLHDPVKLAEQIAVADIISGGRVKAVMGTGYVLSEFAMFRRSIKDRAKLMDTGVPIILRALSGERFVEDGREIFVRPLPIQDPHDVVVIGGGVPASAKRAARFGLGMMPMDPGLVPLYNDECAKLGKKPGQLILGAGFLHVSEDPERTWAQVGPHILHFVQSYSKFAEGTTSSSPFEGLDTPEKVRASGVYRIVTVDEAVRMAQEVAKIGASFNINPTIAGLDPKVGWECLELIVNKVVPRVGGKGR
jgi:alkanesulfonate monooxygenase SsuD/methylene tetrahydromethanopterin reductase-like flavin-dependent oxidoreductase (luciferase family)